MSVERERVLALQLPAVSLAVILEMGVMDGKTMRKRKKTEMEMICN